jgi:predicted nicotinamide N-methyase
VNATPVAECVARVLEGYQPARVLLIGYPGPMPASAAEAVALPVVDVELSLADAGRFDFALVADLTENREAEAARLVLGRLKNLHTDRFLVLVDPARSCLARDDLLELALAPLEQLADGRLAWLYDIDRYNPQRPWNNPDDWANPENFDRFRW